MVKTWPIHRQLAGDCEFGSGTRVGVRGQRSEFGGQGGRGRGISPISDSGASTPTFPPYHPQSPIILSAPSSCLPIILSPIILSPIILSPIILSIMLSATDEQLLDLPGLFWGIDAGGFVGGEHDADPRSVFERAQLFQRLGDFQWRGRPGDELKQKLP